MVVTKCANLACSQGQNEVLNPYLPGPGSSYTMSLTMAPSSGQPVNVALITDGQTNITPGGSDRWPRSARSALAVPTAFGGNVQISGSTISLASGSQLDSFLADGFQAGQLLQISGTATADDNAATCRLHDPHRRHRQLRDAAASAR